MLFGSLFQHCQLLPQSVSSTGTEIGMCLSPDESEIPEILKINEKLNQSGVSGLS
jgi:hypothetical protein